MHESSLRQVIPWRQPAAERQKRPLGMVVYDFMQDNPASKFYRGGPQAPKSATAPTAGVLPNQPAPGSMVMDHAQKPLNDEYHVTAWRFRANSALY
ncbi:MAG: hypothetical protein EOR81_18055 [Mesorhizobium sp.]|nr:MAG: hypothetical protein EOR81_18055 [Mesorhizobium sp.]